MTLAERVDAFKAAYAKWPASWPWLVTERGLPVFYAVWVIGNDYRNKTALYGAYPPGFLPRVLALFPDSDGDDLLHAFSGSLAPGHYTRVDLVDRCGVPDLRFHQASVYDVAAIWPRRRFHLTVADPPYSAVDAEKYGTPTVDRRRAVAALAAVTRPGGYLAWLDTVWPMHSKREWRTVGRILVQRSTNHRARVLSIFERVA